MLEQCNATAEIQALGRFDVFAPPFHERDPAHVAGVVRPLDNHHRDDDLIDPTPRDGEQNQGDQDRRKA